MSIREVARRLPKRTLLLVAALVIAAVAAFGPGGTSSNGKPSPARAMSYVTGHRLDLGAPGIAVGVVSRAGMRTQASGNVDVDTPMVVGSVTKSFTALAVMQLVEVKKLDLDQPVVHYLTDFATADPGYSNQITVRELLSQTSGIPTAAGVDPLFGPETTLTRQVAALRTVHSVRPGDFAYSNMNYEILGELIERVSGQSYAAYLHAHVLGPLDMTHTYTDLASAKAGGLETGHRIWFGVGVSTGIYYRSDFLPAGFLVSTVVDLDHYLTAMLNGGRYHGHSVLSPAGVHTLISKATPATSFGVAGGYGFGWYQRPTGDLNMVIDPGIAQNVHADLVLCPQSKVGVALLANAESDLYLGTIPKFDLAALNATSIAASGKTSSGLVGGLYVIFDLIVAGALFIYIRMLARVIRGTTRWYPRSWPSIIALWREAIVPVVIVVKLPSVYGAPWRYMVTGDVGLSAAVITILGLATLAVRTFNGTRSALGSPRAPKSRAVTEMAPPEGGRSSRKWKASQI